MNLFRTAVRAGGNPGVSTAYSGVSAHDRPAMRHTHSARCGAVWVPAFAGTTPEVTLIQRTHLRPKNHHIPAVGSMLIDPGAVA